MFRLSAALLLLLLASPAWAAIAFDGASSNTSASSATVTISHTVTSNASGILLVVSSNQDPLSGGAAPSGITYNAVAMTAVASCAAGTAGRHTEMWYLLAPATGTHDIVVTYAANQSSIAAGGVSLTGVAQSSTFGTCATATGFDTTPTVTVTSASGEVVIDGLIHAGQGSTAPTSNRTGRWTTTDASGNGAASSTADGGASVIMSYADANSNEWYIVGVPVKPASGSVRHRAIQQ